MRWWGTSSFRIRSRKLVSMSCFVPWYTTTTTNKSRHRYISLTLETPFQTNRHTHTDETQKWHLLLKTAKMISQSFLAFTESAQTRLALKLTINLNHYPFSTLWKRGLWFERKGGSCVRYLTGSFALESKQPEVSQSSNIWIERQTRVGFYLKMHKINPAFLFCIFKTLHVCNLLQLLPFF